MARYLFGRFLWLVVVMLAVSLITFVLMHQIPGGPFDREKTLPAAIIANLEATYNLDAPLWEQYLLYMGEAFIPRIRTNAELRAANVDYLVNIPLGGDSALRWMNFGPSYASRTRNVNSIFRENLPVSAQLGIAAILVASAIGIPLGILAAVRRNSPVDFVSMSVAILGVSIPSITLGPLLRYT
ncbi:MAG: ABC transporter permease, partial [Phototrophicales bacterium]